MLSGGMVLGRFGACRSPSTLGAWVWVDATHKVVMVTSCTQMQFLAPPLRHLPHAYLLLMSLSVAE